MPSFSIDFTGPEEVVTFSAQYGVQWVPDENVTYIKSDGNIHLWVAGGVPNTPGGTYYFTGAGFDNLAPHQTSSGNAVPVLTPSGSGFDKDYAGVGSVIRAANGTDLLMFYHGEDHTCSTDGHDRTKAGIGLARSSDGGITWNRLGQVISSSETIPADCIYEGFKGAGNPTVLISRNGQYLYMYYMEWVSTHSSDAISLARASVNSDGAPGAWYKYKNGGFNEPGLGGKSDVVIQRATETAGYAGVPNVTFNSFLNRYLAIVMGHDGFYYTSSGDGLIWDTPKRFWDVPAITNSALVTGDNFYYYPTLISVDQNTDDLTTHTAYLYYAHGLKNTTPHFMARRPVRIGYDTFLPLIAREMGNNCTGLDWQQPCFVLADRYVVGDIVIDGMVQHDWGIDEGTVAFFEKQSLVYAQWGAGYYPGTLDTAATRIEDELAHGCGSSCNKVRFVVVRSTGQQDALCYYPDGSTQPLQSNDTGTWCP